MAPLAQPWSRRPAPASLTGYEDGKPLMTNETYPIQWSVSRRSVC